MGLLKNVIVYGSGFEALCQRKLLLLTRRFSPSKYKKKCVLVRYRDINMRNLNSVVQVLIFEVLILLNHMNATEKRFCRLPL